MPHVHGRTRPDDLVEGIVGPAAASQHRVAGPQHAEQRAGDGVGAAEALDANLYGGARKNATQPTRSEERHGRKLRPVQKKARRAQTFVMKLAHEAHAGLLRYR